MEVIKTTDSDHLDGRRNTIGNIVYVHNLTRTNDYIYRLLAVGTQTLQLIKLFPTIFLII